MDIEPLVLTWESTFSKNLHQFRIPSSVNDESWHLLMSAVALRHASGSSSDVKGGRLALQTKYELLLLQRQAEKVMRARDEDNTFSKIARLAAAEFVLCLYSSGCSLEQPFEDLVQFALEVYRKVTGQSVGGGSDFKPDWRQVIGLEGIENGAVQSKMIVPCPTTGSEELLSAALRIGGGGGDEEHPDKESTIVPQCPASFLPVVGSRPYSCRLCQRAYNMHVPCCVLCGFAVGLVGPDFLFLPP